MKNNNKLKTSENSNFAEGEALAAEAGDMLNGMMSGMTRSIFKTKLFWCILTASAVSGVGFLIWAVQTIAGG